MILRPPSLRLLPLTIFGTTGFFVFNGNFELSARRGAVIATDLFITGKDYAPPVVALPTNRLSVMSTCRPVRW